jgi:hypothetical protein
MAAKYGSQLAIMLEPNLADLDERSLQMIRKTTHTLKA